MLLFSCIEKPKLKVLEYFSIHLCQAAYQDIEKEVIDLIFKQAFTQKLSIHIFLFVKIRNYLTHFSIEGQIFYAEDLLGQKMFILNIYILLDCLYHNY